MSDDLIKKPVRLLVTHQNPDMDAIGSCWLFLRFDERDFERAEFYFVQAGERIEDDVLEAKNLTDEEVVHVDTGMGVFDHHQVNNKRRDSATLRVYEYLIEKREELKEDKALRRLVNFVNETDHFSSCYWPEATDDRYMFMLEEILSGLRSGRHFSDREQLEFGMVCLDGVYTGMKVRVSAEKDLAELALEFETRWGKAIAIENSNDGVIKLAQKMGYEVVVRKDAEQGHVRIKAVPEKGIDLTPVYKEILGRDEMGVWFLHPAKTMLLNSSKKNSEHVATPLSLQEVVEILKNV